MNTNEADIGLSENRRFLFYPISRVSRLIVCLYFSFQACSLVTDITPKTSAFVHHSETIPVSRTRTKVATIPLRTTPTSPTALFGIKGFRKWFQDQFPNAVRNVNVSEHPDTFDHVLIDMNQILHVVLRRSTNTEQATKMLMTALDTLVLRVKPYRSLVLAIDGSPAAAKIATQRRRRFSILKNTEFKIRNSKKLRMNKRERTKRMKNYKCELQSLQLTPATDCMKTMESAVMYWAWQRLLSQGKPHSRLLPKVQIYFSASTVPGEGEIKLLEWINNYRGHLSRRPGQSIALVGGDADLLLEAMIIPPSWTHNVFVVRQEDATLINKVSGKNNMQNNLLPNEKTRNKNDNWGRQDFMHCTSLWEMTLSLDEYCRKNFSKEYYDPENNPEDQNLLLQIRTDMVLLFMLNGNDYLPRVVAVGFRGVLRSYLLLLKKWIERKGSIQNVGLVDPNTLTFRSDFCADFFHILGRKAPSEKERLKSVYVREKKSYLSMLNDMTAIGYIPTPVRFRVLVDGEWNQTGIDYIETESDVYGDDENDDGGIDGDEDIDEDIDDEDIDDDDIDDEDDEDDDDDDDEDDAGFEGLNGESEGAEVESKKQLMQLIVGKKGEADYHEYSIRINMASNHDIKQAKRKLAKRVLKLFDLIENAFGYDENIRKDYKWAIKVAATANVGRYLAGLIWTLQTYQDGVCPTYHYNYGKCMAPTGNAIASYFVKAMDENRSVSAAELLGQFEPGGSVKAGVACLAALPISVKDLVPKPYSLVDDDDVEDFYCQCMDPTDNFFHLKKFETLVDAEVERLDAQRRESSSKRNHNSTFYSNRDANVERGKDIVLGDHYWTTFRRMKDRKNKISFNPPPPPTEHFSRLPKNNHIRVGRMYSLDFPSPRTSINYTMSNEVFSNSKVPLKLRKETDEIDFSNFGYLINGTKSSILDTRYKIAFGSSLGTYGGSQQVKGKTKFKLMESDDFDFPNSKIANGNSESNSTNLEGQNALAVLQRLVDIRIVRKYIFSVSPNGEVLLNVSFETNGMLPLKPMSFSQQKSPIATLVSTKQQLASLALDAIMDSKQKISKNEKEKRWHNLTFDGMVNFVSKDRILIRYGATVRLNPDQQNSMVIIKQLNDAGIVQSFEFNEVPASKNRPEKISLTVFMPSEESQEQLSTLSMSKVAVTRPGTLFFECSRTTESKKWIRQHLVSLALDSMIAVPTSKKGDRKLHWYDLSFKDYKDRIKYHRNYSGRRRR